MEEILLTRLQAKALTALSEKAEPVRAMGLTEVTEESAMTVGRILRELERMHLSTLVDKKNKLWQISDTGKQVVATLQAPDKAPAQGAAKVIVPPESTVKRSIEPTIARSTVRAEERYPEPTTEAPSVQPEGAPQIIVPSQAAIFREIGERLGVTATPKKGEAATGATLDAIIYFVERTADMNNLTEVWNSVTQMNIPAHIVKRWITLYAQTIPGKQIPEELKDKLEVISEKDRVSITEKGEIAPKPKRFSIVAGEIIGDPEGDYFFNEALKALAQQKGVPAAQADPLATMVEAMRMGPEMATATLAAMVPLLTKEAPKHDDSAMIQFITAQQAASQSQMQLMQQMLTTALEGKHNAEIESVKALVTQKPPESSEQMRLLTEQINNQNQQLNSLRESLHTQQITAIQEQHKMQQEQMQSRMDRMEQQMLAAAQGKSVETKLGLLDKGIDKIATGLDSARQDAKGFATMVISKGEVPVPRTAQQRRAFGTGMEKAIEKQQEAKKLGDKLWGTPQG